MLKNFCNDKKYSNIGETEFCDFKRNKNNIIADNLLVKR